LKRVLTHTVAVALGVVLALASTAIASRDRHQAPASVTHQQILTRLGNPFTYTPAGTIAAQVGDVRREIMSVEGQLRRLCVASGTSC
jgi:hypothetical protein